MWRTGRNSVWSVLRRLWSDEDGDVLMEYVIVTLAVILPLVGISEGVFNPTGQTFNIQGGLEGDNFGLLGNAFVDRLRMLMTGIGLPLP